jgi:hypothetical protein
VEEEREEGFRAEGPGELRLGRRCGVPPADSPDLVLVFAGTEQEFRRRSTKARVVVAGGGVVLLDLRGDPLPDLPPTLVAACGGVGACGVRRWWREWR